ncbi:hypothetical protein FSARC_2965 [Fusarium sarcochroum]|uniref:Uncharacterized protein n=1 Tax=Fusarium sarcochroum TaxID=1208366 RepID=A0A8H4U5K5_9HYPO|nr:hypothetical protein FSARC_2965 [Fusarium sarcochroum]
MFRRYSSSFIYNGYKNGGYEFDFTANNSDDALLHAAYQIELTKGPIGGENNSPPGITADVKLHETHFTLRQQSSCSSASQVQDSGEGLPFQLNSSEAESASPSLSFPDAGLALKNQPDTCAQWIDSMSGPGCNQQNGWIICGDADLLEGMIQDGNPVSCRHVGATKIGPGYQQNGHTFEIVGVVSELNGLLKQLKGSTWIDSACLPADSQDMQGSTSGMQMNGLRIIIKRPMETDGA